MSSAYLQRARDGDRPPLRRRATSIALTIAAHVLIIWLLFRLAPPLAAPPERDSGLSTFDASPDPQAAARPAPRNVVAKVTRASGGAAPRAPRPVAPPPEGTPVPTPTPPPMLDLFGGKAMFDAADISKIRGTPGAHELAGGEADGAGSGKDSGSAYGPGEGPGGARLFNAEWYREPSRAELAGYLPRGVPPGGWAMIACKTIPDFRVENCRILGEGPLGSGIARAMREASWQFRVRPPRIGGKAVVGAWVRIRFDFTEKPGEAEEAARP